MPIFEYTCSDGHKSDHVHRWSEGARPESIACSCGKLALYGFAAPAPTMGCVPEPASKYDDSDRGLAMHDYRCTNPDCGHAFEEMTDFDAGESPHNGMACPKCTHKAAYIPGAQIAAWSVKQFGAAGGYYDRGLGTWISSPQQRKDEAEKRNLVIYDDEGDNFLDEKFREHDAHVAKEEAEVRRYYDRVDNAPEFAGLRRAMDQGVL